MAWLYVNQFGWVSWQEQNKSEQLKYNLAQCEVSFHFETSSEIINVCEGVSLGLYVCAHLCVHRYVCAHATWVVKGEEKLTQDIGYTFRFLVQ